MTRYLLGGLAIAVAVASVQTVRVSAIKATNAALREDVADAEAERDQALAGSAELSRLVREQQHRDRAARPVLDAIKHGEFDNVDTPLDPALQHLVDCLRTGAVDCAIVPD